MDNILIDVNEEQKEQEEQEEQGLPEDIIDGYDSSGEIKIEISDRDDNKCTQIYTFPYRPTHCNEKRLICFSTINNEKCNYDSSCTYAHSLEEQMIDDEKKYYYQIVLDKNLMNFFSPSDPRTDNIYKSLLSLTRLCEKCTHRKCTGGYNCRNGVCDPTLKICKNDLLTGECSNELFNILVGDPVTDKLKTDNFNRCDTYDGCINGHHLTKRKMIPYYKYVHQKENSTKNEYHSIRYIDNDPSNRIFRGCDNYSSDIYYDDSDSSTDEEINSWLENKNNLNDSE
jgi:hypothetical protein